MSNRFFTWQLLLGILLMTAVLVVEIFSQVLGNVIYVAIAAYTLWFSRTLKQIYFIGAFSTALLVIGYILAIAIHDPPDQITFLVNRASAIVVVWSAGYFTYYYQKSLAKELSQRKEIEERKLDEERLRSSQEMHEAIARNFPEGWIGILDENLAYVFADGKGLSRSGIKAGGEIIGKKFTGTIEDDTIEPFLRDAFNGQNVTFEFSFNNRTFEVNAGPFLVRHKTNRVLVVVHDITSLKETEAGLVKALERERELNELKSRFVTMASHEFRTPLTTILSSTSLLDSYSGTNSDEERKALHVNRIKCSVKLLTEILNDFLSLERLEKGDTQPNYELINLRIFLDEVVKESESLMRDKQQLSVRFSGNAQIASDKSFLKAILHNLLSNAFKYSHPADHVVLETELQKSAMVMRLTDHGMGIPFDDQANVFDQFFRAHNAVNIQGIGLGLCIARRYAKLLGGDIAFCSEPERETVFTLTLPGSKVADEVIRL